MIHGSISQVKILIYYLSENLVNLFPKLKDFDPLIL